MQIILWEEQLGGGRVFWRKLKCDRRFLPRVLKRIAIAKCVDINVISGTRANEEFFFEGDGYVLCDFGQRINFFGLYRPFFSDEEDTTNQPTGCIRICEWNQERDREPLQSPELLESYISGDSHLKSTILFLGNEQIMRFQKLFEDFHNVYLESFKTPALVPIPSLVRVVIEAINDTCYLKSEIRTSLESGSPIQNWLLSTMDLFRSTVSQGKSIPMDQVQISYKQSIEEAINQVVL